MLTLFEIINLETMTPSMKSQVKILVAYGLISAVAGNWYSQSDFDSYCLQLVTGQLSKLIVYGGKLGAWLDNDGLNTGDLVQSIMEQTNSTLSTQCDTFNITAIVPPEGLIKQLDSIRPSFLLQVAEYSPNAILTIPQAFIDTAKNVIVGAADKVLADAETETLKIVLGLPIVMCLAACIGACCLIAVIALLFRICSSGSYTKARQSDDSEDGMEMEMLGDEAEFLEVDSDDGGPTP